MPGVPCARAGVGNRAGCWVGVGAPINKYKHCQKRWSGGALAVGLVGGELGAGNFIYGRE